MVTFAYPMEGQRERYIFWSDLSSDLTLDWFCGWSWVSFSCCVFVRRRGCRVNHSSWDHAGGRGHRCASWRSSIPGTHTHTHWNIHTAHTVIIERIKYVFLLLGSPWKTVQAPVHRPTVTHHHRHYGGHGIGNGYVLMHWAFKRAVQDTIYPSYLIFLLEMAPIRFHVQVSVRHQRKKMVDRISCNIGNG